MRRLRNRNTASSPHAIISAMRQVARMRRYALVFLTFAAAGLAQPPMGQQPEFIRQGQQLVRQGKLDEALALYRKNLEASPDSAPANSAAGVVLDLMGRGADARKHFAKAIESSSTPQAKAGAERAMAMSWAFEGNCRETAGYEQQVFDYYVSVKDSYQQGEIADELARVCIDSGDLDTAYKWYKAGYEAGLKEPDIKPDRKDLWEFRWENAQARIAVRRGNKAEAQRHVAAAKAALDKGTNPPQEIFYPYLTGYVAFYSGDYQAALSELQKANANDPFIACLLGETYDKLGDHEKAVECYRKAAATTAHNPPAAYARPFATKKIG
jgi:tetratricopeptide (TPR) repeat protein